MPRKKTVAGAENQSSKVVAGERYSSEGMTPVWCYDKLDRDGPFAFDTARDDFQHREVLEKIIAYSNMTWADIRKQTHDKKGKSKHHFLEVESLSAQARERLKAKRLEEHSDSIFSFALQNKLRIIGIREDERFHAVWYDPEHGFCPSTKK